jgi:hypothetical protein
MSLAATKLPNGNVAINLPSGDLVDPAYLSASNLVRMGEPEFAAVMAWVDAERAKLAERQAQLDQEQEAFAKAARKDIEARHRQQVAWSKANL